MPEDSQSSEDKYKGITCSLIKKIAPIIIYLLGNEESVPNKWSKSLFEKESVSSDEHAGQYDEQCIFVENEPINPRILGNFIHDYGLPWKVDKPPLLRLNAIRDDLRFFVAVEHANLTLAARGMIASSELCKWALDYHDTSTESSTEVSRKKNLFLIFLICVISFVQLDKL
jgi:hypothetical protein